MQTQLASCRLRLGDSTSFPSMFTRSRTSRAITPAAFSAAGQSNTASRYCIASQLPRTCQFALSSPSPQHLRGDLWPRHAACFILLSVKCIRCLQWSGASESVCTDATDALIGLLVVQTSWGQYSLMDAEKLLLRAALVDPANQVFQLLCEATLPLYPATTMYLQLITEQRSRINSCEEYDYVRSMLLSCSPVLPVARSGCQHLAGQMAALDLLADWPRCKHCHMCCPQLLVHLQP